MKNQIFKFLPLFIVILLLFSCGTLHKRKYHSAYNKYQKKEYSQALVSINKALDKHKNRRYYELKCYILSELKRYKELEETATEGIENTWWSYCYNLYGLRASARYFNLDYEGAIADYEQAIYLDPQNALHYYNYTTLLKDIGKNEQLLHVFHIFLYRRGGRMREIIDKYNKVGDIFFNAGIAYFSKKEYEKAVECYTNAIKNSNYYAYYLNRGVCYEELGQDNKALNDYTKGISLNDKNVSLYENRAELYIKLKEYEKAKNDLLKAQRFKESVKVHQPITSADLNLAIAYGELGNHKESARYYKLMIDNLETVPPIIYGNYGYELISLGKLSSAVSAFQKALELDKKEVDFYVGLAVAYYRLGRFIQLDEILVKLKENTNYKPTVNLLEVLEKEDYSYRGDFKKTWSKIFEK